MSQEECSADTSSFNCKYEELCVVPPEEYDTGTFFAMAFDNYEELLWIGDICGFVTSYYGPELKKYTSFLCHAKQQVRSILTTDAGVYALSKSQLRMHIRRGLPVFSFQSQNMTDVRCMLAMDENRLVIGGEQKRLVDFDITTRKERMQDSENDNLSNMVMSKHSEYLITGDNKNNIALRDPVSLRSEHVLSAECTYLCGLDVQDNLIAVCGYGDGYNAQVEMFDVRTLRQLPSHQLSTDWNLNLRFIPSTSNKLAVLGHNRTHGRMQILDVESVEEDTKNDFWIPSDNSSTMFFDISSSGQAMVLTDRYRYIRLYTNSKKPSFNSNSRSTEFPDTPEALQSHTKKYNTMIQSHLASMFGQHYTKYLESVEQETKTEDKSVDGNS